MTTPTATFAFTKLVVDDLDASLAFYAAVCGASEMQRITAAIAGEPIEEIICSTASGAGIILLKYLERPAPASGEVILGLMTADMTATFAQATAAGGRLDGLVADFRRWRHTDPVRLLSGTGTGWPDDDLRERLDAAEDGPSSGGRRGRTAAVGWVAALVLLGVALAVLAATAS